MPWGPKHFPQSGQLHFLRRGSGRNRITMDGATAKEAVELSRQNPVPAELERGTLQTRRIDWRIRWARPPESLTGEIHLFPDSEEILSSPLLPPIPPNSLIANRK